MTQQAHGKRASALRSQLRRSDRWLERHAGEGVAPPAKPRGQVSDEQRTNLLRSLEVELRAYAKARNTQTAEQLARRRRVIERIAAQLATYGAPHPR